MGGGCLGGKGDVPHTGDAACVYRGMFCMLYVPGGVLVSVRLMLFVLDARHIGRRGLSTDDVSM